MVSDKHTDKISERCVKPDEVKLDNNERVEEEVNLEQLDDGDEEYNYAVDHHLTYLEEDDEDQETGKSELDYCGWGRGAPEAGAAFSTLMGAGDEASI